jgi:hypothetical protein
LKLGAFGTRAVLALGTFGFFTLVLGMVGFLVLSPAMGYLPGIRAERLGLRLLGVDPLVLVPRFGTFTMPMLPGLVMVVGPGILPVTFVFFFTMMVLLSELSYFKRTTRLKPF